MEMRLELGQTCYYITSDPDTGIRVNNPVRVLQLGRYGSPKDTDANVFCQLLADTYLPRTKKTLPAGTKACIPLDYLRTEPVSPLLNLQRPLLPPI